MNVYVEEQVKFLKIAALCSVLVMVGLGLVGMKDRDDKKAFAKAIKEQCKGTQQFVMGTDGMNIEPVYDCNGVTLKLGEKNE